MGRWGYFFCDRCGNKETIILSAVAIENTDRKLSITESKDYSHTSIKQLELCPACASSFLKWWSAGKSGDSDMCMDVDMKDRMTS